jgi:hypothetical protein
MIKLIPNWKKGWKFSSMWYASLGLLFTVADLIIQNVPISSFNGIPHKEAILIVLFGLTILGRFLQMKGKCDDETEAE